jgi:hypothetical protein
VRVWLRFGIRERDSRAEVWRMEAVEVVWLLILNYLDGNKDGSVKGKEEKKEA